MSLLCFQDGQFKKINELNLPIADLGVQRGYGIFDFLRTNENYAVFLEDHLDRFFNSASVMHLQIDQTREEIIGIVHQLIKENKLPFSGFKLILTGGDAADGYTISKPRLSIFQQILQPPPDSIPENGIHLVSRAYQRQLPSVKTIDYLMAIWLQPWLNEQKGDDILYYNKHSITECPRSNIFMVTKDNVIVTPMENMLWGITRKNIMKVAKEIGLSIEERSISLDELYGAKEVFISSSTKRIMPVAKIDHQYSFDTSSNTITRTLWDGFVALERTYCS